MTVIRDPCDMFFSVPGGLTHEEPDRCSVLKFANVVKGEGRRVVSMFR